MQQLKQKILNNKKEEEEEEAEQNETVCHRH
jgi:hypothetical protein